MANRNATIRRDRASTMRDGMPGWMLSMALGVAAGGCGGDNGAPSAAGMPPCGVGITGSTPGPCTVNLTATSDAQTTVQTAMINSPAGSVLCFAAGVYRFTDELSLSTRNITLRGVGDATVFDFSGQRSGRQGMNVTGAGFTIESLVIKNTLGDGVRVQGVDGVTFRHVKGLWDAGSVTHNGRYSLYPVQCNHVVIEDCEVVGASDSGIYVGQSTNIVVRRNHAHANVSGIEIENSAAAEVCNNTADDNTAGILVFNLPNLMVHGGRQTSVHDNIITANNRANFADAANIVHGVPAGTGVMVMAVDNVEVFNNTIRNNRSTGTLIVSWLAQTPNWASDPMFDPMYRVYPRTIWVHDNTYGGNGAMPDGILDSARVGTASLEDIVWDGFVDPMAAPNDPTLALCISANGTATFRNLDYPGSFQHTSTSLTPFQCTHPHVAPPQF